MEPRRRNHSLMDLAKPLMDCSESPLLDIRFFIAEIKQCSLADVYGEIGLTDDQLDRLNLMCCRRQRYEPVAYIIGKVSFWDMDLEVNASVLIPRPDTELLVSRVLAMHAQDDCMCLELGVGSGAISLALSRERPGWIIDGIDCSNEAIEVAQHNRDLVGVDAGQVSFYQDSWWSLNSLVTTRRYALIVSNPPYVSKSSEDIHLSVDRYEPKQALYSDDDGLADIEQIILIARLYLQDGGWLYLEHGFDQGARVRQMLESNGYLSVTTIQDFSGHDRVTYAHQ